MQQNQKIQTPNVVSRPSQLERFNLTFEYDKTLQQLKRETRVRTL